MGDNEEVELRLLSRKKDGNIIKYIYSCPCGRGTIEEEQDYTPGHRNGFAWINCKNCNERYAIDFRHGDLHWYVVEKGQNAIASTEKNVNRYRKEKIMIYDNFDELGKNNIKATRTDFTSTIGVDGMKDIIRKVLLGGNVRDITEFITQRRLISSYAAMIDLFVNTLISKTGNIQEYSDYVARDLECARGNEQKTLDLWLMGLTKKGLDNIVRDEANLASYKDSFAVSTTETIADIQEKFGGLSGTLKLNGVEINLDWNVLSLLCIALGSQTLSIRGSAKSMNGKLFEKLILGSLLTIMGFRYCSAPPARMQKTDKLFWLSNMDENERETDATLVYNGIAISIDIGFIGKGNPEISLDKVTRFNRYKQIAGMGHEMKTIIIVDTVAENSDLFNKAKRVDGIVLQMSQNNWVIDFAKTVCRVFSIQHDLSTLRVEQLDAYLRREMARVNINAFIE
jgi:hypothetical protein